MPGNRKNFKLQTYVDDNGVSWNMRGEDGGAAAAVDGHAAAVATQPTWWKNTRRQHARHIVYQDPATFRTVHPIFYTATAYNGVALGDVVAVPVPGAAASVNYVAVKKVPEKQASRASGPELAD